MAYGSLETVLHYLRRLRGIDEEDDLLLARYVGQRDESAFAALVQRHGPLVWGACARMLPDGGDAEDAFQATFLVLARKAHALRRPGSLAPWLHEVACRTAAKARALRARRLAREQAAPPPPPRAEGEPEIVWREVRAAIDEEVNRLPERYRVPFALCYLEGLTNEEAARRLACPKGTILSRLARARERLRESLARRGLAAPAALLGVALMERPASALSPALVEATARLGLSTTAHVSAHVLTLAQGALHGMFLTKMKLTATALVLLALLGSGVGLLAPRGPAPAVAADKEAPQGDRPSPAKVDPGKKAPPAVAKAPPLAPKGPDVAFRTALRKEINFEGIEADQNKTLKDGLGVLHRDELGQSRGLTFDVNEAAFKAEGVEDVSAAIIATREIPPMKARLSTVLHKVLSRVPAPSGATFLIRKDTIEITTVAAVRAELGIAEDRPLLPLVWETFDKEALPDALNKLGDASGFNVVVDPRVADQVRKVDVSARLANVPVDTAVQLLADMAGVGSVRLDNVLYVTGKDNAQKLARERGPIKWIPQNGVAPSM